MTTILQSDLAALARALTGALAEAAAGHDAAGMQRSLPAIAARLAPAFAGMRQRLAGLDDAECTAQLRAAVVAAGDAAPALRGLAALLTNPRLRDAAGDLLLLYLLLWLLDQDIIAAYSARHETFDLTDPPAGFWYPRIDTAGSHAFFQDGIYLANTIPAVADAKYYNAEIYNSTQTDLQPKNVIVDLFPVDDPKDTAHFLYDLLLNVPFVPANGLIFEARIKAGNLKGGSRGWGFWNTDVLPFSMQIAWFIQYEGVAKDGIEPIYPNGFYAITQNGLSGLQMPSAIRLPDLDEDWHDYRIAITGGAVEYFIDGRSVAKVSDPNHVPSAPMAFHYWVDNALFGMNDKGLITHILQTTTAPRSNSMKNLRLQGLPAAGDAAPAAPAYTPHLLLPQSQSPDQLAAWLSANHTAYDMTSWCLFGNLIGRDRDGRDSIAALSSVIQPMRQPLDPSKPGFLPGLRLRSFTAGLGFCDGTTDGYLLNGTMQLMPTPDLAVTAQPWSVVASYGQAPAAQSTLCMSLLESRMGTAGAAYMLTGDLRDAAGRRLQAEIRLHDRLGVVNEGFSPAAFLPQWMTPAQQDAIRRRYGGQIGRYLEETGDAMAFQGAYYYSMPMLAVTGFRVTGEDGLVQAEGEDGHLWFDFVVQSFDTAAWRTVGSAQWTFFAIQFPARNAALMVSEVVTADPPSTLPVARYFAADGPRAANGALVSQHEWSLDRIRILPDKSSLWTGAGGAQYYMKYDLFLDSDTLPVALRIESMRDNQEIYLPGNPKYEGVFRVSGAIAGEPCEGWAWAELHTA